MTTTDRQCVDCGLVGGHQTGTEAIRCDYEHGRPSPDLTKGEQAAIAGSKK